MSSEVNHNIVSKSRVLALDGLRGIAILGVLIGHAICPIVTESKWADTAKAVISLGTFGVDTFFVLSGFLISKIIFDNHESKKLLKVFWIRRLARIMPLYVGFITLLYLLCIVFFPDNLPEPPYWAYLLYLQNFYIAAGANVNHFGFDITWSLVIEEHFYLIFPTIVAMSSKNNFVKIIAIICLMGIPMRYIVHPFLEQNYGLVNLNFRILTGRIDQLGLGVLLAYMVFKNKILSEKIFSPLIVILAWLTVAVAVAIKCNDHLLPAIAAFLTIGSIINGKWLSWTKIFESTQLRFFGRISYALYLFHAPLFWYPHKHYVAGKSFIFVIFAAIIAIILAWLSTKFFEEPILKKARRYKY